MSIRRQARECSLQMLYMFDNCKIVIHIENQEYFPNNQLYRNFSMTLFNGVRKSKDKIDSIIQQYATNWDIDRISVVDRNILRIAIFEIIAMPDIPINVVINEAIEISKKFSTTKSGKFINGIMDKVKIFRYKNK